jgi:hypothetical protein
MDQCQFLTDGDETTGSFIVEKLISRVVLTVKGR